MSYIHNRFIGACLDLGIRVLPLLLAVKLFFVLKEFKIMETSQYNRLQLQVKILSVYIDDDKDTLLERLDGFLSSMTETELKTIWNELTEQ